MSVMSESNHIEQGGFSKLIMFGIASLLLCVSVVMSIFTPLPVALASVLYGRVKAYLLGTLCASIAFYLHLDLGLAYLSGFVVSIIVAEIVKQNKTPVQSMVKAGSVLIVLFYAISFGYLSYLKQTPVEYVTEKVELTQKFYKEKIEELKGSEEAAKLEKDLIYLSDTEEVTSQILEKISRVVFLGVFFILWANLYVVLRARRLLLLTKSFKYDEKSLLNFKVSEKFVWPVIVSLALSVFGDEYIAEGASNLGLTVLYCLGVFYFFQGFGILTKILDRFEVFGFFRTLLVIVLVVYLHGFIALMGLFDIWVDFSRFTKKNSH